MARSILAMFIIAVVSSPAGAALYKCEAPDGSVIYTDEPCPQGQELDLPPLQTYTPVPVPGGEAQAKSAEDEAPVRYEKLAITQPENDAVVSSTPGTVNVALELQPELDTGKGHKFAVALDGKQLPTRGVTSQIRLNNVDRGTHTVQAFVVGADNNVLLASNTVTFHLRRETVYEGPSAGETGDSDQTVQPSQKAPKAPGTTPAPKAPINLPRVPVAP